MSTAATYPAQRSESPRDAPARLPVRPGGPTDASRWFQLSLVPAAAGVWLHVLLEVSLHL